MKNKKQNKNGIILLIISMILISIIFTGMVIADVTLNSPPNATTNSFNVINFNCSAETSTGFLTNISLWTNSTGTWHRNSTNDLNSTISNSTATKHDNVTPILVKTIFLNETSIPKYVTNYTNTMNGSEGNRKAFVYLTFVYANGTTIKTGTQVQAAQTSGLHIFNNPAVDKPVNMIQVWLNSSASPTQYVWEKDDIVTYYTNTSTTTFLKNITGYTLWNCESCSITECSFAASNYSIDYDTTLNSVSYNLTTYETSSENYVLNITSAYTPTNAKLIYNGIEYSATITTSGTTHLISKNLQIPSSSIGSNYFYFKWNVSSTVTEYSINYTQTVSPILFGICNATLTVPYLNLSFKNETDLTAATAAIDTMTVNYWIDNPADYQTYLFANATENVNYTFCFNPNTSVMQNNISLKYSNTGYPQRTWVYDDNLSSTLTSKTLYLLPSSTGLYSVYQVVTPNGETIQGVNVVVERQFGGTLTLIEEGTTDSAGTVTFWLNPDYDHRLTFSKTGYATASVTIRPSSSTYTVTMGNTTSINTVRYGDELDGIDWEILPKAQKLRKDTDYTFQYTVTAAYNNLTGYRLQLMNNESVVIASGEGTNAAGGTVSLTINTLDNDTIKANISINKGQGWIVIDNDRIWPVMNETIPSRGTVKSFLTNIGTVKFFGQDYARAEYSRFLLFFFIMFVVLGFLSYTTGWDVMTGGGGLLVLWIMIVLVSMAGGFEVNWAVTGNELASGGFLRKYTVALIYTFFTIGFALNNLAKERGQ
jgi:hypothetical protein